MLKEYREKWQKDYARESTLLQQEFSDIVISIHHVGSTAIKNMPGKGIIDILMTLKRFDGLAQIESRLSRLGYVYRPVVERPESPFFTKPRVKPRSHNLHLALDQSERALSMLAFRDYLRFFPEEAQRYAKLKRKLYEKKPDDWRYYRHGKADFVAEIHRKAVMWSKAILVRY